MGKKIIASVIAFWMAIGINPAWALLMPHFTLEELVAQSNTIVSGHCVSFHYHPSADGKVLYAVIRFEVEEYLKNDLGKRELSLLQVAREENLEGLRLPGSVSFGIDEEAYLFLSEEDPDGFCHIVGLSQGKFDVRQNRRGKILIRNLAGVQFFDREMGALSRPKGREEKPVAIFREDVKRIASELNAKPEPLLLAQPNRSF